MAVNSFFSSDELQEIGLKKFGQNVLISRKASIYSPETITIGDHVRIDDFCILSGTIHLGSFIHISAYTALYARFGITVQDYVTISGRVMVYSQSDTYSGAYMTNPMVPSRFTHISGGPVIFEKHVIVAAGSIIFPNVTLHEGAAIGAMSLVNRDVEPWTVQVGIPIRLLKPRDKKILELEQQLMDSLRNP